MKMTDIKGFCLVAYFYRFIIHDPVIHILPVYTVFQVLPVYSYAALAGLVGLAGGEAAHIVISDGRVLGLNVYSILPGSSKHSGMGRVPSLQVLATG